ncbi:hypothetical protein M413DRAFT_32483 [Hebeloma cylindrosporum]|uniref:Uncharacterized protein n=1 Tax=Hebeloma cylindrosporum TaxID=76867 RepID=A0A0C3BF96_HEBCY|nr:hypothetical protein M413DRAFT_32483 [Hebeloma cylindrosporum h7]
MDPSFQSLCFLCYGPLPNQPEGFDCTNSLPIQQGPPPSEVPCIPNSVNDGEFNPILFFDVDPLTGLALGPGRPLTPDLFGVLLDATLRQFQRMCFQDISPPDPVSMQDLTLMYERPGSYNRDSPLYLLEKAEPDSVGNHENEDSFLPTTEMFQQSLRSADDIITDHKTSSTPYQSVRAESAQSAEQNLAMYAGREAAVSVGVVPTYWHDRAIPSYHSSPPISADNLPDLSPYPLQHPFITGDNGYRFAPADSTVAPSAPSTSPYMIPNAGGDGKKRRKQNPSVIIFKVETPGPPKDGIPDDGFIHTTVKDLENRLRTSSR